MMEQKSCWLNVVGGLSLLICTVLFGCANQPKESTTSQPTVQDVRGDSDRFFQKMESEEKSRSPQ